MLRAGVGDGADVLLNFLRIHANAVVADGQGPGILVHDELDLPVRVVLENRRVLQRLESRAVNRVGRVGDELPQKNLLVGVKGVDDQVEHLLDLCLEFMGSIHKFLCMLMLGNCFQYCGRHSHGNARKLWQFKPCTDSRIAEMFQRMRLKTV